MKDCFLRENLILLEKVLNWVFSSYLFFELYQELYSLLQNVSDKCPLNDHVIPLRKRLLCHHVKLVYRVKS